MLAQRDGDFLMETMDLMRLYMTGAVVIKVNNNKEVVLANIEDPIRRIIVPWSPVSDPQESTMLLEIKHGLDLGNLPYEVHGVLEEQPGVKVSTVDILFHDDSLQYGFE